MAKIYPDFDSYSMTRVDEKPKGYFDKSDKNINSICVKPCLKTKEVLEQLNKDINATSASVLNCDKHHCWILSGLLILFTVSCFGTIVMWLTSMFDNAVFANLMLVNQSQAFEMWRNPSPKPVIKFYLFNYTNIDDFEMGLDEKLHVEEVGPYVYEETMERMNIHFDENYVTYQEKKQYKFMPHLSKNRKQSDKVIVPNIPLFGAASLAKNSNFLTRLGISSVLSSLDAKPFLNIAADRIILGYDDELYSLAKSALRIQNKTPYERIGLLAGKNGLSNDVIVMNTGEKNINDIEKIVQINGEYKLEHWSTDQCNSFNEATDGIIFSSRSVREKQPVQFFIKEFCRTFPLEFERESKILNNRIPAYRYTIPYSVFDAPDRKPENQCFCNMENGVCPPQGIFNATPCAFGVPVFLSFPHFYNADPKVMEGVTGLNPNHELHKTHVDLHPTMGFAMSGKTRFQMNIQVQKSFGLSQVDMFEDGVFLPVSWFEMHLEDKTLPEDIVSIIFQTTFTVKSIELGLKYTCLLTVIITSISTLFIFRRRRNGRRRSGCC